MTTIGHRDPTIPARCRSLHDEAVRLGQNAYVDPETGYWVLTASALAEKGRCCGCGCRHCPYPPREQRAAGRKVVAPESTEA